LSRYSWLADLKAPPHAASATLVLLLMSSIAQAQPAQRDLSGFAGPKKVFTVVVTVNVPEGTQVAGYEDMPPSGWVASNISDSGTFDGATQSVKWGPFLAPAIPASISYDVTTPHSVMGAMCFDGSVSFDGSDDAIEGDLCTPANAPVSSSWGLAVFALLSLLITKRCTRRLRVRGVEWSGDRGAFA
jgi:hypothetical protein